MQSTEVNAGVPGAVGSVSGAQLVVPLGLTIAKVKTAHERSPGNVLVVQEVADIPAGQLHLIDSRVGADIAKRLEIVVDVERGYQVALGCGAAKRAFAPLRNFQMSITTR